MGSGFSLSVPPHISSPNTLNGIQLNLLLRAYTKSCSENSILVYIDPMDRAIAGACFSPRSFGFNPGRLRLPHRYSSRVLSEFLRLSPQIIIASLIGTHISSSPEVCGNIFNVLQEATRVEKVWNRETAPWILSSAIGLLTASN
jgi:hypothetical protein